MFVARGEAVWAQWTGDHKHVSLFGFGVLGFFVMFVGWSSFLTSQNLQADPQGYPVRLIIPESKVEQPKRAAPVLLGENAELVSAALADLDESAPRPSLTERFDPEAFERAFGNTDLATRAAPSSVAMPQPGKSGMLSIDFDLEGGASSSKAIDVRKPVAIAGTDSGQLSIRVDGAAKIYAKRSEVASLLKGKSSASERVRTASSEEFVSFNQLRDWGVDIRYDPSADRILIPLEG